MKALTSFIVRVPKKLKDTVKTKNGLELYIDSKFEPFKNRINEGEVVATPAKYDTGVTPGDTIYFHHLVVVHGGQPLDGNPDHYFVLYHPDSAINSQAIAYKSKSSGAIHPLSSWAILDHVEQEAEAKSSVIEVIEVKERPVRTAVLSFESPQTQELGLKIGDTIGIRKDTDYAFDIDEKVYYRTRAEDLMYVEI